MSDEPKNLTIASTPIELFVWVDPESIVVAHNLQIAGQFRAVAQTDWRKLVPFLPNPDFKDVLVSPFSLGIIRPYVTEYNLERARNDRFQKYPSRLGSIFLLPSRNEAMKYRKRYPAHVGKRTLKVARTVGCYKCSEHDSSWIDFLRRDHSLDEEANTVVANAYWNGVNVEKCRLESFGKPWSQTPIREVLYQGAIEFPDRSLQRREPRRQKTAPQSTRR